MRGDEANKGSLFSYIDLEKRVRADHPLRLIREIANAAVTLPTHDFAALYSPIGRESIPPERLLRALLPQAFSSLRSERRLVERIATDPGLPHGSRPWAEGPRGRLCCAAGLSGWASRGPGVERDDRHEASRPAVGRRHRRQVSRRGAR